MCFMCDVVDVLVSCDVFEVFVRDVSDVWMCLMMSCDVFEVFVDVV